MVNASATLPRLALPGWNAVEKREKSISSTSNIARPSTTNSTAMPTLNQGDALMVPKVPAVRITISPSTP